MVAPGTGADPDALGPDVFRDRLNFTGDLVIGLVPAYTLPLTLTAAAHPPHGVFEALWIVNLL